MVLVTDLGTVPLRPIEFAMSTDAPWLILTLLWAILSAWPTWAALIVAQAVNLVLSVHDLRWLPAWMLLAGYAFVVVKAVVMK